MVPVVDGDPTQRGLLKISFKVTMDCYRGLCITVHQKVHEKSSHVSLIVAFWMRATSGRELQIKLPHHYRINYLCYS